MTERSCKLLLLLPIHVLEKVNYYALYRRGRSDESTHRALEELTELLHVRTVFRVKADKRAIIPKSERRTQETRVALPICTDSDDQFVLHLSTEPPWSAPKLCQYRNGNVRQKVIEVRIVNVVAKNCLGADIVR